MANPKVEPLQENILTVLTRLFVEYKGEPWAPKDTTSPVIQKAIDNGFVRRIDGRVGFEALRDAMLAWTQAGYMAMELRVLQQKEKPPQEEATTKKD